MMSPAWFTTYLTVTLFTLTTLCGGWWQAAGVGVATILIIRGVHKGAEQETEQ